MPIVWDDVRYRGDARDVQELFSTYRVEDYLDAFEEDRRRQDLGLKEQLLRDGIRLTEQLSPRIFRIFGSVCANLGLESKVEVFCLPSAEVNAFAAIDLRKEGNLSIIGLTSAALEKLDDGELQSIIGHELGHFLFGNNRLEALVSTDEDNPAATVLPPLGESLFMGWRKKAEISADRVSLLASRDFVISARALMKATFGLSERNLNLDVEALIAQLDEIKGRPELMEEAFASHPLLPIRLKALKAFAQSAKARRAGLEVAGEAVDDDGLESEVDELVALTRRSPHTPLEQALMRAVARAGALLLGADGDVNEEEVKVLVNVLHAFTDEPEKEIVADRARVESELRAALATVRAEGGEEEKLFVLSRLAEVALADGALMDEEGAVILEVAGELGISTRAAYSIMIGAAQSAGFRSDAKLNRLARELQRTLESGLGRPAPKRRRVASRPARRSGSGA